MTNRSVKNAINKKTTRNDNLTKELIWEVMAPPYFGPFLTGFSPNDLSST